MCICCNNYGDQDRKRDDQDLKLIIVCDKATSLSNIPWVETLILDKNKNIKIVSGFENLVTLSCNDSNVEEVSFLKKLKFFKCRKSKLKEIKNLNLRSLDCSDTDIESISSMDSLIELYMNNNRKLETLNFRNLHILDCKNSRLKELPFLQHLRMLDISFCDIEEVKGENFPNLEFLTCIGNKRLKSITGLPSLCSLTCKDSDISVIKDLNNLDYLDISNIPLKTLSELPNIEYLEMNNIDITSIKLHSLETLKCRNCKYLLDVPIVYNFTFFNCPWVYPVSETVNSVICIQKFIKKYLQIRDKKILLCLNRKIPYELSDIILKMSRF